MADQKISELTALTGANVADDDAIAIVDTSATETKKIVFSELKNALDTATGFVRITGDTMTGALDVQSTITSDGLTVAGIVEIDGSAFGNTSKQAFTRTDASWSINNETDFRIYGNTGDTTSPSTKRMALSTNGDISFYEDTGTTAKFFWDASAESLGIGTSSPSSLGGGSLLNVDKGSSGNIAHFEGNGSVHLRIGETGDAMYLNSNNGVAALAFQTNGTEAMRIDSSGNVGIGTSSLDNKVNIQESALSGRSASNGNTSMTIEHATDTGIQFFSATQTQLRFGDAASTGAGSIIYEHATDKLRLSTDSLITFEDGGVERMRIDSSGNLLVGTTLTAEVDESGTRIVAGDAGYIEHSRTSTTDTLPNVVIARGNDGEAIRFIRNDGSNREVGDIVLATSSTSYNTSSDYRLKENVIELTGATTRLKQLEPKRFNFIADADTTVDGFLAHEVQSVVPEAITGTHNEVDADGNPVYQGIDQSKIVPLLVATIKELEARITALESN